MKQEGGFPAPPPSLCHCKCQDFGSEQNPFQVSQPESLTARTKTGALPGFCLFLSLAGMSVVVNNASFSPSPDNDRHFSFCEDVREIKIIVSKGSWIQLVVLCVLGETVCLCFYLRGFGGVRILTDDKGVAAAAAQHCSYNRSKDNTWPLEGQAPGYEC